MLRIVLFGWGRGLTLLLNKIQNHVDVGVVVGALLSDEKSIEEVVQQCIELRIPHERFQTFDSKSIELVKMWNPDIIVSISFTKIVPRLVLSIPRLACLNLHLSALPSYRGVHPLNWALIKDEREIGATVHIMDEGIDSGPIVKQQKICIDDRDDIHSITGHLLDIGTDLLLETIIEASTKGSIPSRAQSISDASFAPKRTPTDSRVSFQSRSREIFNMVRALKHPHPMAFCEKSSGEIVTIKETFVPSRPGLVISKYLDFYIVGTSDGVIMIKSDSDIQIGDQLD